MRPETAAIGFVLIVLGASLSGCTLPGTSPETAWPEALLHSRQLVVEIDYVANHPLCPGAEAGLLSTLERIAPDTTITLVHSIVPATEGRFDNERLSRLAQAHRDHGTGFWAGDAGVLHVLLVGGSAGNEGGHTAGRTLHDDGAIFLFPEAYDDAYRIDRNLHRDASCEVERAVLLHEVGHALGLVNRGIPMLEDREADDHAGHSTNARSVMYPTLHLAHDGLVLQRIPAGFDAHDLQDLITFRG